MPKFYKTMVGTYCQGHSQWARKASYYQRRSPDEERTFLWRKYCVETSALIIFHICGAPSFEKWPKNGIFWPKFNFFGNIKIKLPQVVLIGISKILAKIWPYFGTMPNLALDHNFWANFYKIWHFLKKYHELIQI